MQRSRAELEAMTHDQLVDRILEMQDILREGLAVRDSLHHLLNDLLKAKAHEVEAYANALPSDLSQDDTELKILWAKARHAVSNPQGLVVDESI
ncbi:MAG: hypothetical protein AAF267_14115 [Deinococcota bacterium]